MKILFSFLSASLMAVGFFSAVPAMADCTCEICTCTPEDNCGCLETTSPKIPTQSCDCGTGCKHK